MPTKIILDVLLLTSAIIAAFTNRPGGSCVQCDPNNPRSPSDARRKISNERRCAPRP